MRANRNQQSQSPQPDAPRRSADPYLDWARATEFRYLGGPPDRIPLLVELNPGVSYEEFRSLRWAQRAEVKRAMQFAPLFLSPPAGLEGARFCTVLIASRNPKVFDRVVGDPGWEQVVARFGFGFPPHELRRESAAQSTPRKPAAPAPVSALKAVSRSAPPAPRAAPVVVGVIDDSIAFAHARFRYAPEASRVEYVWNQDVDALYPTSGAPSAMLPYGGELNRDQIDAWLRVCTHAGAVDEDELYRRCGHETYGNGRHKAIGRRLGHGTHVLDLAAGYDIAEACTDRPIVAVQLPAEVTGDTSGAHLTTYVLHGIWYVLKRADEYAQALGLPAVPVVINLSYGFSAGPHDGSHALEQAIDEIIELRAQAGAPLCVVLPSGNTRLVRGHAQVQLKAQATLDWRVLPDDRTPSSMEIWLPPAAASGPGIEVQVRDPNGTLTPVVARGGLFPPPAQQPAPCTIDYRSVPVPGGRERIVLLLLPTAPVEPLNPNEPVAPAGNWQVTLRNRGVAPLDAHVWIQRDDSPVGYPVLGRQSYFDDPDYVRFDRQGRRLKYDPPHPFVDPPLRDSYVKRTSTLNALATGRRSVVVAGFVRSSGDSADYSSMGPIVQGPAPQRAGYAPDVAAVSDDSPVLDGVLAAGTRSGSVVAMNGTSVAAPQIARYLADIIAAEFAGCREAVRDEAARQELAHPMWWPQFLIEEAGAGRVLWPATRPVPPMVR
jgi:hypothetical protein